MARRRVGVAILVGALGAAAPLTVSACAHEPPPLTGCVVPPPDASALRPSPEAPGPPVELVESWPVETTLDHEDIPDAKDVWVEMIDHARESLDIGEFYVSDAPGKRLHPVLEAIERAAGRGVAVRLLVERIFYDKYPESVQALSKVQHVAVEVYDVARYMGGIHHAKYFVVDGREAYIGSQNFDWRSLEHIQEIGVRVRAPAIAGALEDIFDTDWDLASSAAPPPETRQRKHLHVWPVVVPTGDGGTLALTPVATPKGWLPDESTWTLTHLLSLLEGARKSVHVQVLTYAASSRNGQPFNALDDALRATAARGVHVELLVSSWAKKGRSKDSLDALAKVPGIEVRVITIPEASTGPIPFARVSHAKFMVVDGEHAWVGSSNWEGDYFEKTRNVGLVIDGASFATQLDRVFDDDLRGTYSSAWGD